ncbi:DUF4124 domain-containing protein [Endozoicomonas montiporae]|uniref:PKD domain-containing protein n=1 Tax=Endozoicomonas montiporae CL-33 TaxID=570277 RepID=A0A142BI82_9GAMM|nr:DUF4124 domain-containing protein [Endozoicomonas montiporae]AMO58458.1 PKD domain-containing protein [Endozoicomonas montiporae CL-33]
MKINTLPLLLLLMIQPFNASGQIYKTVDEHGNTVFTDKPPASRPSEPVILKPATSLPAPDRSTYNTTPSPPTPVEPEIATYSAFYIGSPANNSTVRNNGDFTIKISIRPSLARGHKVRFFIDGKLVSGPQRLLSHNVKNMDRGTHQLKAEVLDNSGKVIQKTESTVHVQRTIFRPPAS